MTENARRLGPAPGAESQRGPLLVLDAGPEPHVRSRNFKPCWWQHAADIHRALGQQLPIQPWCGLDQLPQTRPHGVELRMELEDVRHTGAEHSVSASFRRGCMVPCQRLTPVGGAGGHAAGGVRRTPNLASETMCQLACVAVVATWRDFQAAPPGIKCVIGPLDFCFGAHFYSSSSRGVRLS